MKNRILFFNLILLCTVSLYGQKTKKQPLKDQRIIKSFFNKDSSAFLVQYYDQGKRIGPWMTYKRDSSKVIEIYEADTLKQYIELKPNGDTALQKRYVYTFLPNNKLHSVTTYENHILSSRRILDYNGKDSIVENLKPGKYDIVVAPPPKEPLYMDVSERARFIGEPNALLNFISDNLQYPPNMKDDDIEGETIITFVVELDGSVSEVRISRSSGFAELDNEAKRLILKSHGKWIPAKVNGHPVRSVCKIPITFSLENH